jgi:hypothetical protein
MYYIIYIYNIYYSIAATVFLAASLCGCADFKIAQERSDLLSIKNGMSKQDVVNVMGAPTYSSRMGSEETLTFTDAVVVLDNEKVVNTASQGSNWHIETQIESYVGQLPKRRVCAILPSIRGMGRFDLEFQPVKKIVTNMLIGHGYRIVDDPKKSDVVVFVNFGLSEPKSKNLTWSEPVFSYETPKQTKATHRVVDSHGSDLGTIESESTSGTAGLAYKGNRIQTMETTVFIRHLVLEAVDRKALLDTNEVRPFWKVIAISEGSSDDFRGKFPYIALAADHFIELDSGGKIKGNVFQDDPRIARLTGTKAN